MLAFPVSMPETKQNNYGFWRDLDALNSISLEHPTRDSTNNFCSTLAISRLCHIVETKTAEEAFRSAKMTEKIPGKVLSFKRKFPPTFNQW